MISVAIRFTELETLAYPPCVSFLNLTWNWGEKNDNSRRSNFCICAISLAYSNQTGKWKGVLFRGGKVGMSRQSWGTGFSLNHGWRRACSAYHEADEMNLQKFVSVDCIRGVASWNRFHYRRELGSVPSIDTDKRRLRISEQWDNSDRTSIRANPGCPDNPACRRSSAAGHFHSLRKELVAVRWVLPECIQQTYWLIPMETNTKCQEQMSSTQIPEVILEVDTTM